MNKRLKCSKDFLQIPSAFDPKNTSIGGLNGNIWSRVVVTKPDCREVRGNETREMQTSKINYSP